MEGGQFHERTLHLVSEDTGMRPDAVTYCIISDKSFGQILSLLSHKLLIRKKGRIISTSECDCKG